VYELQTEINVLQELNEDTH